MTPDVTPLVLLVLLAFFFVVALAFTVWAALTVGDAAKRTEQKQLDDAQRRAGRQPPREPKPWERQPAVKSAETAVQGTLWERRADQTKLEKQQQRRPEGTERPARKEPAPAPAEAQQGSRAVVTPRKADTDAFERFLESEKRRD